MQKQSNKGSLQETFQMTWRAVQLLWKPLHAFFQASALCALADAGIPYVGIYLSARILNELAGQRDPKVLTQLVLTILISTAVLTMLKAGLDRWKNAQQSTMYFKILKLYSDKLLSMDFVSLDDAHTHNLLSQIRQNQNWNGFGLLLPIENFELLINACFKILGGITLTVSLFTLRVPDGKGFLTSLNHPAFIVGIILVMILVIIAAPAINNKADEYWLKLSKDKSLFGNRIFSFFLEIQTDQKRALDLRLNRQDLILRHSMNQASSVYGPDSEIARAHRGPVGILSALSAVVSYSFTGIIYAFVCLKAWGGAFGIGSVTQYISAVTILANGLTSIVRVMGDLRINVPFLRTIFEFLDISNSMYQGSLTTEKRSDRHYEIEFRDVSFRYPNTDSWALRHVSLKFQVGKRLAVVGQNGSGKTTFIKLLCRLYDPTEGEILLNGINIRKYGYLDYQSIFSVVFQDFQLLAFSLGQNVAASMQVDVKRATHVLEQAGFSRKLKEMPAGLDTCLYKEFDEAGVEISGGEAQTIAVARALYKDAPFIILDEPTAALDPIAEAELYAKFDDMVEDKTAIYISHRLSSCRFCDGILVFDTGHVIQHGSHEDLLADEQGKYYELWNSQAHYYKTSDPA